MKNYLENNGFPNITDKKFYYEAESIAADIENGILHEVYHQMKFITSISISLAWE